MRPPQSHSRGARRELDRRWLDYLQCTADTGNGQGIAVLPGFLQGIQEFNDRRYFESHETWESAWRDAPYPECLFLLGLTKLAVGLAHANRGNVGGARRLLTDGLRCLECFPEVYAGVDVAGLRATVRSWPAIGVPPIVRLAIDR